MASIVGKMLMCEWEFGNIHAVLVVCNKTIVDTPIQFAWSSLSSNPSHTPDIHCSCLSISLSSKCEWPLCFSWFKFFIVKSWPDFIQLDSSLLYFVHVLSSNCMCYLSMVVSEFLLTVLQSICNAKLSHPFGKNHWPCVLPSSHGLLQTKPYISWRNCLWQTTIWERIVQIWQITGANLLEVLLYIVISPVWKVHGSYDGYMIFVENI